MQLLENKVQNVALQQKLERAVVVSAQDADDAAFTCRAIVVKYWRIILKAIAAGGSAVGILARVKDATRAATKDLVAHMDDSFRRLASRASNLVDRAMFEMVPDKLARLVEDAADDYLQEYHDPIEDWPANRRILPLPPDPPPARRTHYTGQRERRATIENIKEIIKRGDYAERMARWAGKQITNNRAVANAIAKGVAAKKDLKDIAKEIEPYVRNLSSAAMRIVRTEAARIHNEIAEQNYAQYDILIAGYRVINPLDERTRPEHRKRASERNANGLIGRIYWKPEYAPKGASWFVADRPSLPDAPNCRCGYVPVMIDPENDDIRFGKPPKGIRDKVDDIEHDVSVEELERYRERERKATGTGKKARAGIRHASPEINARLIGTREWVAARQLATKPEVVKKLYELPTGTTRTMRKLFHEMVEIEPPQPVPLEPTKSQIRAARTEDVRISDLIYTQDELPFNKLKSLISKGPPDLASDLFNASDKRPVVVRYRGKLYLVFGHDRAVWAEMYRIRVVPAKVIDLDRKGKT
jgi:SPP1 gp7 family putative phage head morphogenesis protein